MKKTVKMEIKKVLFVVTLIFCVSAEDKKNPTVTNPILTQPKTCSHHETFGPRLSCIGEKFTAGNITAVVANMWTHEALRLLDLPDKYYSIGVVTGTETKVVMARQDSYAFDWALALPLAIYNAFSDDTLIMNEPSHKPILIYSRNVGNEIQAMPEWNLKVQVPELSDDMKPLYRHPEARGGSLAKNCKKFEEWRMREFAKDTKIAIIMPSDYWCPESTTAFDVFIANVLPAGARDNKKMWYFEWYRSKADEFGEVPIWAATTHFR